MGISVKRMLIVVETNGVGGANAFQTIYGKMEKFHMGMK